MKKKLNIDQVRSAYVDPRPYPVIAKELGVHISTICNIKHDRYHRAYTEDLEPVFSKAIGNRGNKRKGEQRAQAKLTQAQAQHIIDHPHISAKKIADAMGVCASHVAAIRRGVYWSHLKRTVDKPDEPDPRCAWEQVSW